MRSTRRTLRTAAVLAGAATVLALPIGTAFAASPGAPGAEARPERAVRVHVTDVKLADGSVAKVYRTGSHRFEADIFSGATRLDTLVSAGGGVAYGRDNGLHVVLHTNGTVTSWTEGAPKPAPKPESRPESDVTARIVLPDGHVARLADGRNGKSAEILLPGGKVLGRIDLKHPRVQHAGWTYELVRDGGSVKFVVVDGKGGGASRVYDFGGKLIEKYAVAGR
ncbi:hypothetical protein ACN6AT_17785 [Streptomyces sp. JL4002]|uniref:hypothetical protein n=1 Tax=Streptomyces sp. JL4002 TaxID=3404781 RepID=UPI003B285A86